VAGGLSLIARLGQSCESPGTAPAARRATGSGLIIDESAIREVHSTCLLDGECLLRIIPIERVGRLSVERSPIPHADVLAVCASVVKFAAAGELEISG